MSKINKDKLTPMMRQYFEIKEQYEDYILFYRLGDFYEMFFDDAVVASKALEITLTGRNCGLEERAPLCGIPYHAMEGYLKKLIEKGFKVAICEQVEDPALAKGIVKREVIRVITPGTVIDPDMLDATENNYIAAISMNEQKFGLAYCDITTGTFKTTEILEVERLIDEIIKIDPSEIITNSQTGIDKALEQSLIDQDMILSPYYAHAFGDENAHKVISRIFKVFSVESIGLNDFPVALSATGALLSYIEETAKTPLSHLHKIEIYHDSNFMILDKYTRRNLELVETMRSKEKKGSLLWVLDKTATAMGARKLKAWIEEPLIQIEAIKKRHQTVAVLVEDLLLRSDLREYMKQIYDLERLTSKLVYGNINPRDLVALKNSLFVIPEIKTRLEMMEEGLLKTIYDDIDSLEDVYQLIEDAIVEEPPYTLKDGGVIKTTYNTELENLRDAVLNGKQWILDIENKEKEKTGIKTLKIGFNKVFGYYIEISKGSAKLAPEHYIRKQTLANAERYITPELKKIEETVLHAEEKIGRLESELFSALKQEIMVEIERIQKTAYAVASLDALVSFAEVSYRYGYVMPKMSKKQVINIKNGRHPVIERIFNDELFIPNDTLLDQDAHQFYIITGPNMAGKSTYLRQVALITLMAQIGCFVPADRAEIGIVDRIFTRVGASDDLSQGQSTFMVEMNELANILNNASPRALIILDEIGRGTSTYDGLSIAWSVVEYISKLKTKALFATHYHELTELEGKLHGVCNFRISVKESKDDILFLRKIERGGANQSYGIQVAKLAGVPNPVIERAKEILAKLEVNDINNNIHNLNAEDKTTDSKNVPNETLGDAPSDDARGQQMEALNAARSAYTIDESLFKYLENIDVEQLTPIESMNTLYQIVSQFKNGK
ncbi:DNA mismatch repair protein MutS [Fusibacter ferrireducens]|nr:DNA mismatch repair protein MutS [Fusibacter ferrireducens]